MHTSTAEKPPFVQAANVIAEATGSDVMLINSPIMRPLDTEVLQETRARRRRKNLVLVLVTSGGDASAAYRIARFLQDSYESFTVFVTGYCKSAGTLVAIGAAEIVIADSGELGPLDVQMSKPDELAAKPSGLTATSALATLNLQAFASFESFFLQLVHKSGSAISTRTATQLAAQLVCGLFAPLYGHIDPMHVGEAGRALQVAQKYGALLHAKANNLKPDSLAALTNDYPSHGFVIDREESKRLFRRVREPNESEGSLLVALGEFALDPIEVYDRRAVLFLSDEPASQPDLSSNITGDENNGPPTRTAQPQQPAGEQAAGDAQSPDATVEHRRPSRAGGTTVRQPRPS